MTILSWYWLDVFIIVICLVDHLGRHRLEHLVKLRHLVTIWGLIAIIHRDTQPLPLLISEVIAEHFHSDSQGHAHVYQIDKRPRAHRLISLKYFELLLIKYQRVVDAVLHKVVVKHRLNFAREWDNRFLIEVSVILLGGCKVCRVAKE